MGPIAMNAKKRIREYKSHMRQAPSELNPDQPKYKLYGKIKDDVVLIRLGQQHLKREGQ